MTAARLWSENEKPKSKIETGGQDHCAENKTGPMNKHAFQRPKSVQEVQNPNADPAQYPEVAAVKTPLYKPFIIQPINMKMWWQVSSRL